MAGKTEVNHRPGREVTEAHAVRIAPGSRLASIAPHADEIAVNSSHHQAAAVVGDGLRATAICPADGVIEALEDATGRFVVGVQWHPERGWRGDPVSQALFSALIEQAHLRYNGAK